MTSSCSAKDDEKYLVKGFKRKITMLSFLNWAACRNNARFSWPVMWWCTNSQDASLDVSLMQRFWFCTNSVMIQKCDDAQILGKRERDGTKLGEMQISRESTRRVHRCPASSSHHLCILSNSYRALRNCTKLQAVCAGTLRHAVPSYLWQLGKKLLHVQFFNLKKVQKQDNQRRDNTDGI